MDVRGYLNTVVLLLFVVVAPLAALIYLLWRFTGMSATVVLLVATVPIVIVAVARQMRTQARERQALLAKYLEARAAGRHDEADEIMISLIHLRSNMPRQRIKAEVDRNSKELMAEYRKTLSPFDELLARGESLSVDEHQQLEQAFQRIRKQLASTGNAKSAL